MRYEHFDKYISFLSILFSTYKRTVEMVLKILWVEGIDI